jgi:hypothetical protein
MKILSYLLTPSFAAFLLVGASAASPATCDLAPGGVVSAQVPAATPESALKWAMPADVVRQIMGEPERIKPMQSPTGKAEIWVFSRQLNQHVDRLNIGSVPIMTTSYSVVGSCNNKQPGPTTEQQIGETIVYGNLYSATEETVELLMFNEHFVTHRISRQNIRHFN